MFSVQGKGVKVSKSGYVVGTIPGSSATVTVKDRKVTTTVDLKVSDFTGNYLTINKNTINVYLPKPGAKEKTATLKLATPKMNQERPSVVWSVEGAPEGITVNDGKISVGSNASPGCYEITATSEGYNTAYCELIVIGSSRASTRNY